MNGHALISADVLARYAGDAAREVPGVHRLVESALHRHKGVKVAVDGERVAVELHLALEWGASAPEVGAAVQERVAAYLERMADLGATTVDVVVDEVAPRGA